MSGTNGVQCMWMRGGTSKGGYFLAEDLPRDRDPFLLRVMGSPDPRQIDGLGGAHPLTSKVAVVSRSTREDADVDYLFLQVFVDQSVVTDRQNCGNIITGVGPFAIERGLVQAQEGETEVRIYMVNTGQYATATVQTTDGSVSYDGTARIDGVPGTSAPVPIMFRDTAGSTCGALLPTGKPMDVIDGIRCTLIDNGMPCIILRADSMGLRGDESPADLEADIALRERLEAIRLKGGPLMKLGDVSDTSVPKMTLVSPPMAGGTISTRSFIPHRCHDAIGVLAAATVATACTLKESPAHDVARAVEGQSRLIEVEHPTGEMGVLLRLDEGQVVSAGVLRTARKLFDGIVFV